MDIHCREDHSSQMAHCFPNISYQKAFHAEKLKNFNEELRNCVIISACDKGTHQVRDPVKTHPGGEISIFPQLQVVLEQSHAGFAKFAFVGIRRKSDWQMFQILHSASQQSTNAVVSSVAQGAWKGVIVSAPWFSEWLRTLQGGKEMLSWVHQVWAITWQEMQIVVWGLRMPLGETRPTQPSWWYHYPKWTSSHHLYWFYIEVPITALNTDLHFTSNNNQQSNTHSFTMLKFLIFRSDLERNFWNHRKGQPNFALT